MVKRYSHLSNGEVEFTERGQTGVGIQHLDFSSSEVYLCFVAHPVGDFAVNTQASGADFKSAFLVFGLIFILSAYRTMYMRCAVNLLSSCAKAGTVPMAARITMLAK